MYNNGKVSLHLVLLYKRQLLGFHQLEISGLESCVSMDRSHAHIYCIFPLLFCGFYVNGCSWLKVLNIDHPISLLLAWSEEGTACKGMCMPSCSWVWLGSCVGRDELWFKASYDSTHVECLYPVWVLWCLVREELCVKAFPQSLHS